MRLSGAVAVVTDVTFPIGRAIEAALRREGATVAASTAAAVALHGRLDLAVITTTVDALESSDAAARAIAASGGGAIVSIVTVRALSGDVRGRDEAIAGAAVIAGTRAIATQFGRQGVRADTIAVAPPDVDPVVLQRSTLLARAGVPDDVASLVVFLGSDDASFVTGQVLRCDGGLLAHLPHYAALVESGATTTRR